MADDELLAATGNQVATALSGHHQAAPSVLRSAYQVRGRQRDALPQESISRFSDQSQDRIIAQPAQIDTEERIAELKWIYSFTLDTGLGSERASAVMVLNSTANARATAILEGSAISAKLTEANAALASVAARRTRQPSMLELAESGLIDYEALHFLLEFEPAIESIVVYDSDVIRTESFIRRDGKTVPPGEVKKARDINDLLAETSLISFATTAPEPHVTDLSMFPRGIMILHISPEDIARQAILEVENIVDAPDHACTARRSVHLAEQNVGHRDLVRTTICNVLFGRVASRGDDATPLVLSPFQLGAVDFVQVDRVKETVQADALTLKDFWPAPRLSGSPGAGPVDRPAR
ncbi:hypothetical protein [Amycolatopsis sp. NPDC054798]